MSKQLPETLVLYVLVWDMYKNMAGLRRLMVYLFASRKYEMSKYRYERKHFNGYCKWSPCCFSFSRYCEITFKSLLQTSKTKYLIYNDAIVQKGNIYYCERNVICFVCHESVSMASESVLRININLKHAGIIEWDKRQTFPNEVVLNTLHHGKKSKTLVVIGPDGISRHKFYMCKIASMLKIGTHGRSAFPSFVIVSFYNFSPEIWNCSDYGIVLFSILIMLSSYLLLICTVPSHCYFNVVSNLQLWNCFLTQRIK